MTWKLYLNHYEFENALDGFTKVFDVQTYLKLKEQGKHDWACSKGFCCDIWVKGDCFVRLNFARLSFPSEDDKLFFNEKINSLVYSSVQIESPNPEDFKFVVAFLKRDVEIRKMDRNFNLQKIVIPS